MKNDCNTEDIENLQDDGGNQNKVLSNQAMQKAKGRPKSKCLFFLFLLCTILIHLFAFANLTISLSEITYLAECMDDWIPILFAAPFLVAFRVIIPDNYFSTGIENTIKYNLLWLLLAIIPVGINLLAVSTHGECAWFYMGGNEDKNVTMDYIPFNGTAPVILRRSTRLAEIVMSIGKNAIPLSLSTTLVLAICWNIFLQWGKRNKRRLSSVLKDDIMGAYGDDASAAFDAAAVLLSRIS